MIRIAIDGPGGAGKSTVAKAVAKRLDILYVDTGALYRTVGLYVRSKDVDPKDAEAVSALLPEITLEVRYEEGAQHVYLNGVDHGDAIRTPEMSMYASAVSAIPAVRAFLLETQKDIARKNSVIMDGRDIGTVIIPDADLKIFLTASAECRATRRYKELLARGQEVRYEDVLAEMNERDGADSSRAIAPTKAAEDAIYFDNSDLDFEQTVERIIGMVNEVEAKKKGGPSDNGEGKSDTENAKDAKKKKKVKRKGSRAYRVCYALFAGIVSFLFNYKVINQSKERDEGGYIVCGNHVSATDAIALCYAFRKNQVRFMAKKELFKIPLLAQLIKMLGAFPIDRSGGDVGAIKSAVKIVKDGGCLGIFPQGHRYPGVDPRTTSTKNGMALIASRTKADIVPTYIWRKKNKFRLFRRTYIIIGDPISFESLNMQGISSAEYTRVTELVFDRICTLGEEFTAEREAKKAKKK